ncbi:MAG: Sucraseferredoxin family protein [Bacteroidetes bacterium]|nr:Sucraseferredoxin family protein [Bacteroidota bacterium]
MESNLKYDKHIFICTNQRVNSERPSCGEEHGMELVKAFKKEIKDRGLNVTMRAQKAGCLDLCETGPSVVVYPEGVFYGHVQLSDVMEIIEEHLINDRPVERLRLKFQR